MPLIKPVIRNGIILVGLASTLFFAHTVQAAWNGQPYAPGSTLNPECLPTQPNCTVAPYTLQNITDQGYTTNRPIRVNGVSTTANILPTSNNLYDLGEVSNYWHRLFAKNVSSTNIDALGYVSTTALWVNGSPVTSNVPTLQQVTNQGYFTTKSIGFTGASSTGNIIPTANGLFDLGSATKSWKNIYASSTLYAVNGKFIDPSAGGTPLSAAVNSSTMFQVNQYGIGIGSVAPSNPDDFVHVERNNNTATGILVYNRQESVTADSFIHLFAGNPALGGADLRITAKPGAAGGYVNLTAQNNTGLNIMNNSAAPINFYTSSTQQGYIDAAGNMTLGSTAGKNTDNSLKITNNSGGASARAVLQVLSNDAYFSINAYGTGGGDFVNLFAGGSNTGLNILNGASSPISFYTGGAIRSKIDASGFSPGANNTYDLGTSSLYWRKLFVKNVSSTNIDALGYVSTTKLLINGTEVVTANPSLQQVTDQGATTNKWIRFAGATSTGSINPTITNFYDLGSNTNAWRGIYASSTLDVGSSFFKVDQNGAAIGDGTINNKLSINQLNSNNALLKLLSTASTPGASYAAAIDFFNNYPGTTDTFNFGKLYTRSDCGLWVCGRLTLSVRDSDGNLGDGMTIKGSSIEANKINIGIGTTNPYLYRLTVAGTVAPSSTNLYDLGSSEHTWRNVFASGTIMSGDIVTYGQVLPGTTNSYDLGGAANYWRKLFVNNVSTTNIDALGNLGLTGLTSKISLKAGALPAVNDAEIRNFPVSNLGVDSSILMMGYNLAHATAGVPAGYMSLERNYHQAGSDWGEWYLEAYDSSNRTSRPISANWDNTNINNFAVVAANIAPSATDGYFAVNRNDTGANLFVVKGDGSVNILGTNLQFPTANSYIQSAAANPFGIIINSKYVWHDSAKDGLLFGSAQDTNLYRSGANVLATDDGMTIAGGATTTQLGITNLPTAAAALEPLCVSATGVVGHGTGGVCPVSALSVKTILGASSYGLEQILDTNFYDYTFKDGRENNRVNVGPVADYLKSSMPSLVLYDTDGNILGYDYVSMIAVEGQAIKDLNDKIKDAQTQIDTLKISSALSSGSLDDLVTSGALALDEQLNLGPDSVGQAKIMQGDTKVTVQFDKEYPYQPIIALTPMDKVVGSYWISTANTKGFSIQLEQAQTSGLMFGWHAFGSKAGKVFSSDGSVTDIGLSQDVLQTPVAPQQTTPAPTPVPTPASDPTLTPAPAPDPASTSTLDPAPASEPDPVPTPADIIPDPVVTPDPIPVPVPDPTPMPTEIVPAPVEPSPSPAIETTPN
ncbi:MAG: hypothetical protein PHC53_02955 [Patescibacteria group bacterium]|nr:hypothetical protein [Patescibacteria group bacterium]